MGGGVGGGGRGVEGGGEEEGEGKRKREKRLWGQVSSCTCVNTNTSECNQNHHPGRWITTHMHDATLGLLPMKIQPYPILEAKRVETPPMTQEEFLRSLTPAAPGFMCHHLPYLASSTGQHWAAHIYRLSYQQQCIYHVVHTCMPTERQHLISTFRMTRYCQQIRYPSSAGITYPHHSNQQISRGGGGGTRSAQA